MNHKNSINNTIDIGHSENNNEVFSANKEYTHTSMMYPTLNSYFAYTILYYILKMISNNSLTHFNVIIE